MAPAYPPKVNAARLQVVANQIDAGSSAGSLQLTTAGGAVLSTITLRKPCGTVSQTSQAAFLVFSTSGRVVDPSAAGSGTAVTGRFIDGNGNVVVSGLTVGNSVSSADIVIANGANTTSIQAGSFVQLLAAQITAQS